MACSNPTTVDDCEGGAVVELSTEERERKVDEVGHALASKLGQR